MTKLSLKRDIQAVYDLADRGMPLANLMEAICGVLSRHEEALKGITYSYRLCAGDTGYVKAFALVDGRFAELGDGDMVDVTVAGKEEDLRLVFRREMSPMSALLRGRIKVVGSKAGLIRLAEFL